MTQPQGRGSQRLQEEQNRCCVEESERSGSWVEQMMYLAALGFPDLD